MARQFHETLFMVNASYVAQPMLVDTWDISSDGLTYTFTLREGIPFHETDKYGFVAAEDAVASLKRWGKLSAPGRSLFKRLVSLEAVDERTIVLKLTEAFGGVLTGLGGPGSQLAIVMPKEIIEEAEPKEVGVSGENIETHIGAGPFQFVEWIPDLRIRMKRFDGYKPRLEEPSLFAGRKTPYLDELVFHIVPEASTRLAGLKTGRFDYVPSVSFDQFDSIKDNPDLQTFIIRPFRWLAVLMNHTKPPFSNKKARQALLAASDPELFMRATYGREDFWQLESSPWFREQAWWSPCGRESMRRLTWRRPNGSWPSPDMQVRPPSCYLGKLATHFSRPRWC